MFKIIKLNMVCNLAGTISLIIEKGVRRKAGSLIRTETLYKKAPLVLGGKKARRNESKILVTSKMGLTDVI